MAERTEGLWRVYQQEWCVVFVSDSDGEDGKRECTQRDEAEFASLPCVAASRVVPWSREHPGEWPYVLEVLQPVLRGEHRDAAAAEEQCRVTGGVVLQEGSEAERKLLDGSRPFG